MEAEELMFNEFDEVDYYIKDDDADGISLEDSDDSEICEDDCRVCIEPDSSNINDIPEKEQMSRGEKLHYIYMKKFVDSVNEELHEKMTLANKTRDELVRCQERISELEKERDRLYHVVNEVDERDDVPNGDRLRAQHDRAISELEMERGIEEAIKARLAEAEYDLSKAELEKGKYVLAEEDLHRQHSNLQDQRIDEFELKKKNEDSYVQSTYKHQRRAQQDAENASREMERREKQAFTEAMRAQEQTNKYLQQTMKEVRDARDHENERNSADLNRRISAVLSLKKNITSNRENINALRARNKDIEREARQADKVYMDEVTTQGGDAETALLVKKRIEQMEKTKVEHEIRQREAEVKLAAKLLTEDEQFKRRKNMYPHLWSEKQWEQGLRVKPHKKKKLRTLQQDLSASADYESYVSKLDTLPKLDTQAMERMPPGVDTERSAAGIVRHDSSEEEAIVSKLSSTLPQSDQSKAKTSGDGTTLARPEFEGMWNKFERYVVPAEVVVDVIKGSKVSKMDQNIMREKLDRQRENIVQTQIAAGREFKGKSSFNSKPTVVHFKDFDVGKAYKKKVTLTNVSYSINFCKLIGLSDHLKDFIEVSFDPPGQLSAGMTCELLIRFKPMINEDLEGVINFLSQTGPFSLPVVCSTKKCDLSVDMTEVQFGTSVIGETLRRHITLTNNGALGTRLMFGKYTGKDHHIITAQPNEFVPREDTPGSEAPASPAAKHVHNDHSEGGFSKPLSPAMSDGEGSQADDLGSDNRADSAAASSIGASLSEDHDLDLDGMMVSEHNSTYIKPFSEERLEIVWKPTVPGKCDAQFILAFEDELSKDITLTSSGTSIDVPVYVTRQNIDLQICMLDRLYQDSIVVKNRATSALKLMFDVPAPLRKHMELLPKTGFVQAQSSFSAQLKFLPRANLAEDAYEYFDKNTGVMEVPLTIHVADQTRPVPFVVHAIVTNSDLQFDVKDIDFGHSTIHESVRTTIKLTNNSILPQEFGFMGLPEYVDIQPNDGFGLLLPEETIELDVIFSPPKAKNYTFELCCKSLINREFKIRCKGVGVHPPMELSDQVIHFKATSLNDYSLSNIYAINNHLSTNEYTHPVPRIGKGTIAPVCPTSYEFKVPEGAPLTLYPSIGTVKPGERVRVQVRFAPTLPSDKIRQEAVRVVVRKSEERAQKEYEERIRREKEEAEAQAVLASVGANAGKKKAPPPKPAAKAASPKGKGPGRPQTGPEMEIGGPEPVTAPEVDSIKNESDEFASAHSTLLRQFEGDFQTYIIPCYIASGPCSKPGDLKYSIHNTLYLEVHCPIVKPQVVVISDNGRFTVDYGDVSIGQQMNKTITIQNICGREIDLSGSLLDTTGPFEMRNPLRELPEDSSHSLIIRFAPLKADVFQETLHIYGPESTLHVNLLGRGVNPTIQLNLEDRIFDMGAVLVNEYVERTFKIKNTSSLSVDYTIKFDSLSPLRYKNMQELPSFVRPDGSKPHVIGAQNYNGKCVFDCTPYAGTIPGGGTQEITLTFAPDHESDYFSDGVHVELFNMEEAYSFQVIGQSKEHIMYVTGGQLMKPDIESLLPSVQVEPDEDAKPITGNILLMFYSVARDGVFSTATEDLIIGCVRTMAVSQKKNGEYAFENMNVINAKGFTITEPKSYLEAGTKKNVAITWTPPETHNPDEPIEASIIVTTKCELAENYQILLRGLIVSRPPEPEQLVIEDLEGTQASDLAPNTAVTPAPGTQQNTPVNTEAEKSTV